ncbi:DUF4913 domain-containing protein [Nocardia amamiensis]|uniref:DUF4913 domain-containing protein n=1 Tax=Nocardia amamiensis TaxID=404578 RepID=A0ABS0D0Y4_9NOCA|nr:DUF4913 domain-containing protein [Nocardia amamiensis]MBF6302445.1 DUF4913 domain-containing protein [Nocardia amamiensis]
MTWDTPHSQPRFNDLGEFVEFYLLPLYPRILIEASELPLFQRTHPNLGDAAYLIRAWCPDWWRHTEAVARLYSLWHEWEFMRSSSDERFSLSWWFVHQADPHMAVLMSPFGGFAGCSIAGGHNGGQSLGPHRRRPQQLPSTPIPADVLAEFHHRLPPPDLDPPADTDEEMTDL